MKIGDLVRDPEDNDIGIVLGFLEEADEDLGREVGFPIVAWIGWGRDNSIPPESLEILNENR
jgi:hypothetical protein